MFHLCVVFYVLSNSSHPNTALRLLYRYNLVFASHVTGTLEEKRSRRMSHPPEHFEECDICFLYVFFSKFSRAALDAAELQK